jgi:ribonuclease T1
MRTFTKSPSPRAALTVIATLLLGLTTLTTAPVADAATPTSSYAVPSAVDAIPSCALSSLPSQASDTLGLIHSGGPAATAPRCQSCY